MKKIINLSLVFIMLFVSCKNNQKSEDNSTNVKSEIKNPATEIVGKWVSDAKRSNGEPRGIITFELRGEDVIMQSTWVNGLGKKSENTKAGKFSNGILDLGEGIYGGKIVFSEDLKSFKSGKYTYNKSN